MVYRGGQAETMFQDVKRKVVFEIKMDPPTMSNLSVAVASFWQLARHWNKGEKAKLELVCEDGSLHMQLSASLGHPDEPHFPQPPPSTFFYHPPLKKNIGPMIRIGREIQCLPYAGFFLVK